MAKVRVIPSTINPLTQMPIGEIRKRKVAAYARVSTDSDEQYTSYESQCKKYTEYIKNNPQWDFVEVYADEGISGTSRKNRVNFNRMIEDAKAGKIDLIVTKSISRFARNTVDTISLTRELKRLGVEIFFEKENIWSLEEKSEFILTILASAAQEESRSISENVKMGKRRAMQEGHTQWGYSSFLGFEKGQNGIQVVEEEAKIVRSIYRMFLIEGKTCACIASVLNKAGIPTPSGREGCTWKVVNIRSILTNEKYKGDSRMQKTFIVDFLDHKPKKNNGEIPQYYAENTHPYIIEKEDWEMVQHELARRKEIGATYSGRDIFSSKIICADCGSFYGAKVWHSNDKYRRVIYRCNKKYSNKYEKCKTPHLSEEEIKSMFVTAYNTALVDRDALIEDTEQIKNLLTNTEAQEKEITKLEAELAIIAETANKMVKENSVKVQDQNEYQRKYDELTKRYEQTKTKLNKVLLEKSRKESQLLRLDCFLAHLKDCPYIIEEWNEELWNVLLESATVQRDKSITFKFKNGVEINITNPTAK